MGFGKGWYQICDYGRHWVTWFVYKAFSRRSSEHTDRNVELKSTILFRTTPTHLEIIITWCYRKPYYILFPPCKISNPTYLIPVSCLPPTELDPCMSTPCLNGGTCRNLGSSYECDCPDEWEGIVCQARRNINNHK